MIAFKNILRQQQIPCQIKHANPEELKSVINKVCGQKDIRGPQVKAIFESLKNHYHPARMQQLTKALQSEENSENEISGLNKLKIALAVGSLCDCNIQQLRVYYKRKDIDQSFPYKIIFDKRQATVILVPRKSPEDAEGSGDSGSSQVREGFVLHKGTGGWESHPVQILIDRSDVHDPAHVSEADNGKSIKKLLVPRSPAVYVSRKTQGSNRQVEKRISYRRPYMERSSDDITDVKKLFICRTMTHMVADLHAQGLYSGGLSELAFLISWSPRGRLRISYDELPNITKESQYTIQANVDFAAFNQRHVAPMPFWAPELIEASLNNDSYTGTRSKEDDYALGCILHYYYFNDFPKWFADNDPIAMLEKKKDSSLKKSDEEAATVPSDEREAENEVNSTSIDLEFREVIYGLLHPDPTQRISSQEAYSRFNKIVLV